MLTRAALRSVWKRAVGALILSLLLGELVFRLLNPQLTWSKARLMPVVFWHSDWYPLVLEPGRRCVFHVPEFDMNVEINANGYRDRMYDWKKPPGVTRIVCIGDSYTHGSGSEMLETWPKRLEAHLEKQGPVEVWNLGFAAGFSPDSYALFARRELSRFSPDVVIVQLTGFNDLDDINHNLWEDLGPDGFPGRIVSTEPFSDSQGRLLSTGHPPWRMRVPVLRESHLFLFCARIVPALARLYRYGTTDTYTRKAHLAEVPPELQAAWSREKQSLTVLDDAVRKAGARLLVVTIPTILQVADRLEYRRMYLQDPDGPYDLTQPHRRIHGFLVEHGIPSLDVLPTFIEGIRKRRWMAETLFYPINGHFRPLGNDVMALQISEEITRRKWCEGR